MAIGLIHDTLSGRFADDAASPADMRARDDLIAQLRPIGPDEATLVAIAARDQLPASFLRADVTIRMARQQ